MKNFFFLVAMAVVCIAYPSCSEKDDSGIIQFEDDNFRLKILERNPQIDKNHDSQISYQEAKSITSLNVYHSKYSSSGMIRSMIEIYGFKNLENLSCGENLLSHLNVDANLSLYTLDCSNNQISSLFLGENTRMTHLNCSGNQLTALKILPNTGLIDVKCANNRLERLDLGRNEVLEALDCSNNRLTALDVGKSTKLKSLKCSGNPLTSIRISKYHNLDEFTIRSIIREYGDIITYVD